MRRRILIGSILLMCCGCSSMNNTEAGALGGGLIGGALGTIVGAACHNPLAGAAIGAAGGAGIGALAGHAEDRAERREQQQVVAVQQAQHQAAQDAAAKAPRLDQIVEMTHNGVNPAVIVAQIRNSGAMYELTADDITYLTRNNVSSDVIIELQNTKQRLAPGQPVIYGPPPVVYVRPRYYYYDPYPPVAVGIGFHGGYYRRW